MLLNCYGSDYNRDHSDDRHDDGIHEHCNERALIPEYELEEFLDSTVPCESGDQAKCGRDKGCYLFDNLCLDLTFRIYNLH